MCPQVLVLKIKTYKKKLRFLIFFKEKEILNTTLALLKTDICMFIIKI